LNCTSRALNASTPAVGLIESGWLVAEEIRLGGIEAGVCHEPLFQLGMGFQCALGENLVNVEFIAQLPAD